MKIIRATTVGCSIETFCNGLLRQLTEMGHEVVALSSPDEDLALAGRREGVKTIGVTMDRHIAPWKDLKALIRLINVMRQERPDMVHSMTPKAGLLCMMAAWMTRVPVRIHTFTGLVWPTSKGLSRQILKMTDRITCACATHVIPEGEGVLADLRDGGITRKPLRVLGYGNVMGVDMVRFSRRPEVMAKAESLREEGVFRFFFVGRIVGDKGINELVCAFHRLLAQQSNCRLVLVGRFEDQLDPVSAETRQMIEQMPEIVWAGEQRGDDLLAHYAASDCFVFPSYREGFPNTVLEAGALGLPSIVTDINGAREIVVDYHRNPAEATGLIIPSHNAKSLYEAMRWMLEHRAEREAMAENARPRIEARWEQGFVRKCLLDFYQEVL